MTVDFYRSGGSYGGGTGFCDVFNVQGLRAEWRGTAVVRGTGRASRDGSYIVGNWIACRPNCYVYEGTQQVTVTPIANKLTLVAAPAEGLAGRVVHFATSTTDGSAYTVTDWIYVADDTSQGGLSAAGDPSAACVAPHTSCDGVAEATGTMYVRARVKGITEQASARVTVEPDSLVLTPSAITVKPGETATFTVTTRYGTPFAVVGWAWTGNGSPPKGGALTSAASCGGATTCAFPAYESGTLTATATIEGSAGEQAASATVAVTPCDPTGDPRIDDPHFRRSLIEALGPSWSGTEPGGLVYWNPNDSTWLAIRYPNIASGADAPPECHFELDPSATPLDSVPTAYVLDAAEWHGHQRDGEPAAPVCGPPGSMIGRGPSDADYRSAVLHGKVGYMIDYGGTVWRFNNAADTSLVRPSRWRRDGSSICFIP